MSLPTADQSRSRFKVFHAGRELGEATMSGVRVSFKVDLASAPWLERQPHGWLADLQWHIRKLCRSAGHFGKFSIAEDEDSGVRVERL